jgi:hypothetical protein
MPRRPYRPIALLAGALALSLCLVRPVLADPAADLSASAHAAEAPSQPEVFVTAVIGIATEFDTSDFDVELFEASLPRDVPVLAVHDPATATFATAISDDGAPPLQSAVEPATADFDVALFEASLPHDIPAPATAMLAPASLHAGKPSLTSAADHPRNEMPAAKRPLRPAAARGKTNGPARTASPARKAIAAAPPATIPHARPRAPKPDHGPRELFIARLPPDDRDEVMPPQRAIPVIRMPLPPPSLALK